jgi:hypothetical protein
MTFPIIALCICVLWLLVGVWELYKANKKYGGVPLGTAAGVMIFFVLPCLLGIAGSLIGLITNLQHD